MIKWIDENWGMGPVEVALLLGPVAVVVVLFLVEILT